MHITVNYAVNRILEKAGWGGALVLISHSAFSLCTIF